MYVTEISFENYRCFANAGISASRSVNVVVGSNNSGKSTLLSVLTALQFGHTGSGADRRDSAHPTKIVIGLAGEPLAPFGGAALYRAVQFEDGSITAKVDTANMGVNNPVFSSDFPNNFACVFLAKRKVGGYVESALNQTHASRVSLNLESLYARLFWIQTEGNPLRERFLEISEKILGMRIGAAFSGSGISAGYATGTESRIPITAMGDGVPQILALVIDLLRAENKVFVIEELENDLHPKSIRALLDLLIDSAQSRGNQFFISTHSNIVVRHLAAEQSTKVFRTSFRIENRIPTAEIAEVPDTGEARRELLEQLGYELFDAGLYEGYLLLEESSAETIINEFLIPNFAPSLQRRLRTMAAQGFNEAEARFNDFVRLFTFLHLEPTYRDRAWVVFDAGNKEAEAVARMKAAFIGPDKWSEQTFRQWSKHDFERFYPPSFMLQVDTVLRIESKKERDLAKKALRSEVMDWTRAEPDAAREAFGESAQEVIALLHEIESKLGAAK